MITAPTWVILVPAHPGSIPPLWVEHTCGRVHSDKAAREMVEYYRLRHPYIIAQVREALEDR